MLRRKRGLSSAAIVHRSWERRSEICFYLGVHFLHASMEAADVNYAGRPLYRRGNRWVTPRNTGMNRCAGDARVTRKVTWSVAKAKRNLLVSAMCRLNWLIAYTCPKAIGAPFTANTSNPAGICPCWISNIHHLSRMTPLAAKSLKAIFAVQMLKSGASTICPVLWCHGGGDRSLGQVLLTLSAPARTSIVTSWRSLSQRPQVYTGLSRPDARSIIDAKSSSELPS